MKFSKLKITLSIISLLSLVAGTYFCFHPKSPDTATATMWLTFSVLSFAFGWPEVAKSIKIFGSGVDLRDMESSLKDMRKVIEADTRAIFELVQTSSRWGGVPDEKQVEIFNTLTEVLKETGFTESEIKSIQDRWHFWVAGDYVREILTSTVIHPAIKSEKKEDWTVLHSQFYKRINEVTPQELINAFKEFDGYNDEVKELIKDFQYYKNNLSHRRPDIWGKRADWFSSKMKK